MPRYCFHLRDGKDHIDEDGVEMVEDQVRGAAVTAAGEALKELGVEFTRAAGSG
jgi:phosphomannomutase